MAVELAFVYEPYDMQKIVLSSRQRKYFLRIIVGAIGLTIVAVAVVLTLAHIRVRSTNRY